MTHHSHVRLRPALAGIAAAAALLTAGCTAGHHAGPPPTSSPTTTGPTTAPATVAPPSPMDAAAILTRYIKINNQANKEVSPKLNDTIETGALRAQSQAEYKQYPILTAQDRKELGAFTYVKPHFYIPRLPAGQAPWFAVIAQESDHSSKSTHTTYMIFVEEHLGTWRMAAATEPWKTPTPKIALDSHGYATAVDPDSTGLALRPSQLSAAVTDNYTTGGKVDGQVFTPTAQTTEARTEYKKRNNGLLPYATGTYVSLNDPYHATSVWALRTSDGGVLAISSSVHGLAEVAEPGGIITINPGARERAWITSKTVYSLTTQWTCLDAAAIPTRGKARLLGSDCEITDAT